MHYRVMQLHWAGWGNIEVAALTGYSPEHITNIIHSAEGEEIISRLKNHTMDTMADVADQIQAIAPAALDQKIKLALDSPDEKLRSVNCHQLLEMAGHSGIRRVQVERRPAGAENYDGLSEAELRTKINKDLGIEDGDLSPDRVVN